MSSNSVSGPILGVGLGWRRELAGDLLAHSNRGAVDFVELIAESCYAPGPLRREALAISSIWKVIPHGLKLSLGSADGVDMDRARRFGELARAVRAPVVSEHVAFTRGQGREIGHLTQLPLTRTAVAVVARNLARVRRVLPDVPFLLETPAWTLRWPEDEMDEGTFFHEIVQATGCDLLLDLSNVYANALNSGREPLELLRSYPLSRVAMVHLAGGDWRDGFYVDTHAHPTPQASFELLAELLRVAGPVPVLIERDGNYPPFSELRRELDQTRALLASASAPRQPRPAALKVSACSAAESELAALARRQGQLTALLTDATPPDASQCAPFEPAAIVRSRNILHHKRAEEALALLPRLSRRAGGDRELYQLALGCVEKAGRAPAFTAAADALRIAEAAAEQPALADAALPELLQLRARFTGSRATPRARWAPFVGSVSHPDGRRTWAFKPPGRFAAVRFRTSASAPENSANLEIERPT